MRETRMKKYSKLREKIDNLNYPIDEVHDEKTQIVENSIRNASKKQSNKENLSDTSTLSIDELLEGHSQYVNSSQDEEKQNLEKKQSKKKNVICVLICIVIVLVIVIMMITLVDNGGK